MPSDPSAPVTDTLSQLTRQALQGLDALQALAQSGRFDEANARLPALQAGVRDLASALDERRARAKTLHRVLASRSGHYEVDLGLLKQQQEDLDQQIDRINAQIARESHNVQLSGEQIRQLETDIAALNRRLQEREERLEELKRWCWVPGYNTYLAIRSLVNGDITEGRKLMEHLEDQRRELVRSQGSLDSANAIRRQLADGRQRMLDHDVTLAEMGAQISGVVRKTRVRVQLLDQADTFWLGVQRLGVVRTAGDLDLLLAVIAQLDQPVPPALAEDLDGAVHSFRQALLAVSDAVQDADLKGLQ